MKERTMINYYQTARQIHRILVILISFLVLVMASTGFTLKYPELMQTIPFINLGLTRVVHNQISAIFSIILILMAGSGLVMYFYPGYIQWKNKTSPKHS